MARLGMLGLGCGLFIACASNARTLHYGDYSVDLTNTKKTTPALNIKISDSETIYGALFAGTAPANTLRVDYNNTNYWLGPWCPAGTYLASGTTECRDCGIGHYCTGGRHRSVAIASALNDYFVAKGISSVNVNRDLDK